MENKQETRATISRLIPLTNNGRCDWSETSQKNQYKLTLGANVIYIGKSTKLLNAYDVEIVDNIGNVVTKEHYGTPEDSIETSILYSSIEAFLDRKYRKHMQEISEKLSELENSEAIIA